MSEQDTHAFTKKYGPWAVIAGASHGVGAALADQVAAKGLNCVLVARREDALTDLKNQLVDRYGVEVLVVTLDLTLDDAADRLVVAVADREVGLLIYNAGGDPYITRFLDTPVKRYSSGMKVRLAFAVAAHLEPEILLVDEVLAGGDAAF